MKEHLLGLDLGGTSVKGVAITREGEVLERFQEGFDDRQPGAFSAAVRSVARLAEAELGRPARVGLSAPGLAARDGRSIAYMPGRFEGLVGLDWAGHLGRDDEVPVLNDAHAALAGEVWLGAARGLTNDPADPGNGGGRRGDGRRATPAGSQREGGPSRACQPRSRGSAGYQDRKSVV